MPNFLDAFAMYLLSKLFLLEGGISSSFNLNLDLSYKFKLIILRTQLLSVLIYETGDKWRFSEWDVGETRKGFRPETPF